jgi:hypothetical protein
VRTRLVERRRPTPEESGRGADTVFVRTDGRGRIYEILASFHVQYGSWEQWGADATVLGDNVGAIDAWAKKRAERAMREQ